VLVGIPSLGENDRFSGYREDVLGHIEKALADVDHTVFVTPPIDMSGIPGIVDRSNLLIDKCIGEGFDYLWIVQGDVEVPPNAFGSLFFLDVDVAFGVVPRHDDGNGLVCGFLDENKKVWYLPRGAIKGQILSGWVFASGCVLIKRRVLEAGIRFKYEPGVGEDILFAFDVQRAGFECKVHGGVFCGHLPEYPLVSFDKNTCETTAGSSVLGDLTATFGMLDVGCGHRPQGDVNVDLFPEATAHRCVDQRVNDDVALHVHEIPNFVKADACHLPFRDGAFKSSYSWHLIEHLREPETFLQELMRVSGKIEVRCPNGEYLSCRSETKPLHLHDFSLKWFQDYLSRFLDWDFWVRWDYSQSEPWEIVVEGVRKFD
jgi:hypothetical protein